MPTATAIEVRPRHAPSRRASPRAALARLAATVILAGCGGSTPPAPPPPPALPTVASVSPGHGSLGALVTITGQEFGAEVSAIQVTFRAPHQGAMVVSPVLVAAGSLLAVVPGALAEQAELTVTVAGRTSAPVPFTLDALSDPTPGGPGEAQAFFVEVDGMLGRLLPILDANLVPLLEQSGQAAQATSVRSGLVTIRGALAGVVSTTLAGKAPEQLAAIDAFFASPAAEAVRQEFLALSAELPAAPLPRVGPNGAPALRLAPAAAGLLGGFGSDTVESIESAKRFLQRARDTLDKLDWALIGAIAACGTATAAGVPGAAALIPIFEEVRETLVKPLLRLLDAIIPLMGSFPTKTAGGTLRIQVTDNPLYIDQQFGSMADPFPPADVGAVLVTEPYGVKGYLTFKNDGGKSLRAAGTDLLPTLAPVAEALAKLGGFDIGALEVTDATTRLRLLSSDPAVLEGTWADPVLRIAALKPGLVDVIIRADLRQVKETCPTGVGGQPLPGCIPAAEVQVSRTMRAIAGVQVTGPFTQGPRLDSAQVAGQPPATAHLGDVLLVGGEGFSLDPQLAPQDVMFEPAPGPWFPPTGVAGSPFQSMNRFDTFQVEVPDALPGPLTVVLHGRPSNPLAFTVLPPVLEAPPPSAIVGEYQRFTGQGFSHHPSHNEGDWSGFRAPAEAGDHGWLDFTIPAGASSGPFQVVALGQLASNAHPVVVRRWSEPALLSGGGRRGLRPEVAHDRLSGRRLTAWVESNATGATQLLASVLAPGAAAAGTPVILPARLGGHPASPPRPAVAAGNGWLHVAWVERAPGPSSQDQVVTSRSQDGLAWSAPQVLSTAGKVARQPALGADGDLVIAAWIDEAATEGAPGVLRIARSTDAGGSYAAPLAWSGTTDMSDPVVAVRGNAVALAWSAEEVAGRAILAIRSEDGGANYQPAWRLGAPAGVQGLSRHPTVAIGPSCVTPSLASIYLAWEQASSPDFAEEVHFMRLDGLGAPTTPVNVSQSPEHSQSPRLVVDDDCIPALAWLELGHSRQRLLDAGVGRVAASPLPAALLFARSFDGGATFNPRRMTLAKNTLGHRLGHLAMAGGGQALLTLVHQDDFGGAAVAIRTTDGDGGSPPSQPPAPVGELSADLVYRSQGGALWVSAPDGRWLQRLSRWSGGLSAPGLSPDGRNLAWVPIFDQSWVAESDGAHALRVSATADFVWGGHTNWSPRGDWLSVGTPWVTQKLGWIRPDSTGFTLVGTPSAPDAFGASGAQPWSPEGRIAFAGGGLLRALDPQTGAFADLAAAGPAGFPGVPAYPAWSPDGARLALVLATDPALWAPGSLGTGDLYLYDVVLGTLTQLTTGGRDTTPAWSPDGSRLAFGRVEGAARTVAIKRIDTPPGDELVLSNPFLDDDAEPTWLPDGRGVLVARRDLAGTTLTLVALDARTGSATLVSATPAGVPAVQHLGRRPTWPPASSVTAGATGASSTTLTWSVAADDVGVATYQVWVGDTLLVDGIPAAAGGTTVTGLTPLTTYPFTIRACDAAGNCSLTGPVVEVTTVSPGGPPTWSLVPPVLVHGPAHAPGSTYDTPYAVVVHWTAASEAGVEYRVHLDGAATARWVLPEGNTDYGQLPGLRPGTTYDLRLQACFLASQACTTDGPTLTVTTLTDDSPPFLGAAGVLASVVTLDYGEPLDPASTPAPGDFLVTVLDPQGTQVPRAVVAVTVIEAPSRVILTLAEPVVAGEAAAVSYLPGASPLRNTGGLDALAVSGQPLQNGSSVTTSAVAATAAGDVVLVGGFTGAVRIGATLLQCGTAQDGFVARRSAAGQWLWARQLGGPGADGVQAVALDAAGAVHVAGAFSGELALPGATGPITLTPNGAADAFVAKLDAAGQWLWASRAGGAGTGTEPGPGSDAFNGGFVEAAQAVAVDAAGNVYAAGTFAFTASFGGPGLTRTSRGESDLWVGKLDPAGTWLWAADAGSATGAEGAGAVVSDGASVFVAGSFSGSLQVPGLADLAPGTGTQLLVARLDGASGAWLWASLDDDGVSLPGGTGRALAPDGADGVFLGGARTSAVTMYGPVQSPHVSRWSAAGARLWSKTGASTGAYSGQVLGLAPQGDGSLLVGGTFANNLTFGGVALTGGPYGDAFAARLAVADGAVAWAWASGNAANPSTLYPSSATRCGAGRLCLSGSAAGYQAGATFQFGLLSRVVDQGTQPFVATVTTDPGSPAQGAWIGLFGLEAGP